MTYKKRITVTLALLSILMLILSACGGSTESLEATAAAAAEEVAGVAEEVGAELEEAGEQAEAELEEAGEEAGEQEHDIHWGYTGEGGPEHWGSLRVDYAACGAGSSQSPIDITRAEAADLSNIVFNYSPTAVQIFNNGHTIQVNDSSDSTITVDGVVYNLEQFHFHSPSEHALNGELADAEMHLVHKLSETAYAVVGLMINIGAENPAFTSFWGQLPTNITEAAEIPNVTPIPDITFNAADVIPAGSTYYTYPGSLTTPPCSEVVKWLVLTTPIEMSAAQIEVFRAIIEANNRPLQPLNGRTLMEDNTAE